MTKVIFELPFYTPTSGGITATVQLARALGAHLRFQNRMFDVPNFDRDKISYGLPDMSFPPCDIVVTYSDNPHAIKLTELPQVGMVYVYMMSYGMDINAERRNVLHPKITALCTTKKIYNNIRTSGGNVILAGFSLDMSDMYIEQRSRPPLVAINYNSMPTKMYKMAVDVADDMYNRRLIAGVISFGGNDRKLPHKPVGLYKHFPLASRETVRWVFNNARIFIFPSITEGLSLMPIESALCGCPAVICDGAIGEIFANKENCIIAKKNDYDDVLNKSIHLFANYDSYVKPFYENMLEISKRYPLEKLVLNFKSILMI